jgi:hypothetical protein
LPALSASRENDCRKKAQKSQKSFTSFFVNFAFSCGDIVLGGVLVCDKLADETSALPI